MRLEFEVDNSPFPGGGGGGIDGARVVYDYYDNGERQSLTRYADATGTTKMSGV